MIKLHVIEGPDKGHIFPLFEQFTTLFGRSKHADSKLKDLHVSRVHCEVGLRGQRVTVEDLESNGGTFVNGKRISETVMKVGDVLLIAAAAWLAISPGRRGLTTFLLLGALIGTFTLDVLYQYLPLVTSFDVARLGRGLLGGARIAVGPRLGHRVVGVGRREDPPRRRDCVAGQPAGIPRAVKALVVLDRDRAQRCQRLG